ncbi:hypothetical protein H0X48_03000 [Candidatus Dependentiae bacterium]|nr:hypothetical protein [Candidatus Dependentiae bacterium]
MNTKNISRLKASIATFILCLLATEAAYVQSYQNVSFLNVDFDTSFGRNDPFYRNYYFNVLDKINKGRYDSLARLGISSGNMKFLFKFSKYIYTKNNVLKIPRQATPRIPKIIHQIWLGSPFPEKYRHWQKTWQNMGPEWKYILWTDADIAKLPLKNRALYERSTNFGAKSDIARMEILYTYGGVYVDTDFECLKPQIFGELNHYYDFYTGMHPIDSGILLENALIASAPGNPIVKGYIDDLPANFARVHDVVQQTGPGFFTQVFLKHAPRNHKHIMLFPPTFLYPLGFSYSQSHKHLSANQIKQATLKRESLAIHWWEGSWWSNKSRPLTYN